jgi:anthranilate synthase component 2
MAVLNYYFDKIPILGICLGHQAIGEFFGGELKKAKKPMHGKISTISHKGDVLFQNLPDTFSVVRYHSLICENIVDPLEVIAETESNEVMALRHKELSIYGLQFHPEAVLTEYGLEILRNWKNINSISN